MKRKGEKRVASYKIKSASAFDLVAANVALGVLYPDGSLVNLSGTDITVDPSTGPVATYTVSALVNWDQAGVYRLKWAIAGDPELLLPLETYFVGYSDIASRIRSAQLLGVSAAQLPDSALDPLLAAILTALQHEYPCIGDYDTMGLADALNLESAMAYLAAVAITRANPSKYAVTNITQITQGPITYKYGDLADRDKPYEDPYIDSANYHLGLITCIGAQYASFNNSASLFALSGPRRALEVRTHGTVLARLSTFADVNYLCQYGQMLDLNWWYT